MKFMTSLFLIISALVMSSPTVMAVENIAVNPDVSVSQDALINVNKASAKELEALPGVGKSKAAAIIAYRDQFGEFTSLAELKNVKGIGDKAIAKLEGKVRF
ncbi:competence protein ComEA [Pseudoalteromonas ulvae UL12]|uniref:Competence protein n=1 Tax=Pseudoalteromonas ulvae TaxID=107327 RepID=A0A244CUZ0_PSEDV|nr:ComEA family DNA-binding protein [Pseudoalteromonas ulvae]MBE0362605.1 competence protein ComEA [Pseudoalteromonas ulvae UL12]OUL59442.1 competence protein [Pseudoalteromonas ulvae]